MADDIFDFSYLEFRQDYVGGLHVNSSYTAYAQYWHIRNMLNVKKLNFVCDDDRALLNAMLRVFNKEIKNKTAYFYTCQVEKSLSKKDTYREYLMRNEELDLYLESLGNVSRFSAAILMLAEDIVNHNFLDVAVKNGVEFEIPIKGGPFPVHTLCLFKMKEFDILSRLSIYLV